MKKLMYALPSHATTAFPLGKLVHGVCDDTDVLAMLAHFYDQKYTCRENTSVSARSMVLQCTWPHLSKTKHSLTSMRHVWWHWCLSHACTFLWPEVYMQRKYISVSQKYGAPMYMTSPVQDRAFVDIRATAAKHRVIAPDLPIHGISGADTVARLHGIGKVTVIKIAKKSLGNLPLSSIGDVKAECQLRDCSLTSHSFYMCLIWKSGWELLNKDRIPVMTGSQKLAKVVPSPKLCSLPPSNEAFLKNLCRCHLQVAIWAGVRGCLSSIYSLRLCILHFTS